MTGPPPLTPEEFAAAMAALGPFEPEPAIAVGVSGGPDSMALALLLAEWAGERRGRLLALVVDHGLRPEAGEEARLVLARLMALGIEARILSWQGEKPRTGMQAAAREARYALLEAAAAEAGMLHLAVAHHAADQRETVAFRRSRGSGGLGLAGMAPLRELGRARLLRPLLGIEPERLRALLLARGVPWISDPSNRDPRFWRGRHRLDGRPPPPLDPAMAERRAGLERLAAAFLARHATAHPAGFVMIETPPLLAALSAGEAASLALGAVIRTVGGAAWPPAPAQLARLAAWLKEGMGRRFSLGGVLVERLAAAIRLTREPRAVRPAGAVMVPKEGMLWDGRFRILAEGFAPDGELRLMVCPAGREWRERLASRGKKGLPRTATKLDGLAFAVGLPAIVVETLPLLSAETDHGETLLALGPWMLAGEPWQRADKEVGSMVAWRPLLALSEAVFEQSRDTSVASDHDRLM